MAVGPAAEQADCVEDSMSRPIRFAYVGCGFVAQTIHIPNFRSLTPLCEFAAIAEVRQDLGQRVAAQYGIPQVYRSHEEIAADPSIDAVGVSAPYALQGRIAEDLARAGKHVFMEKPMAVSVDRGEKIVAAQRNGGGRIFVAYMKRYDPGNLLVKQTIDGWRASGEAGRIIYARNHGFGGDWTYARDPNVQMLGSDEKPPPAPDDCPAWLPAEHRNSYLGYLQQWTHNVNLLRFLLGDAKNPSPAVDVRSVDLDKGDGMTGVVVLSVNGVRCVLESAYTKFHAWEEHTQVYFERGYVRTDAPPLMQKNMAATCETYRAAADGRPAESGVKHASPQWSYREEARAFLECVRDERPFPSSADDTLNDVRAFETIYKTYLGIR
jgi:predicted dehydrogenase